MVADCARKALASQIDGIDAEIEAIDDEIAAMAEADERARRLMTIPGVGSLNASALVATVQDIGASRHDMMPIPQFLHFHNPAIRGERPRSGVYGFGPRRSGRPGWQGGTRLPSILCIAARALCDSRRERI